MFFLIAAESLAQADQEDDRGDAPDDSEHGQEAAQLMRSDGGGGLPNHFPNVQVPIPPLYLTCWRGLREPELATLRVGTFYVKCGLAMRQLPGGLPETGETASPFHEKSARDGTLRLEEKLICVSGKDASQIDAFVLR